MMKEGATLDEILHTVRPPQALEDRPHLQPVYDEPELVVRNVWRHARPTRIVATSSGRP